MTDMLVEEEAEISGALMRRIMAAIADAGASRAEIGLEWPECHRKGCQYRHGNPDLAFGIFKTVVARAVERELNYHSITRPDVAQDGDAPEEMAIYTLTALLHRYNVHDAGTFVKAARLIVEAYPALVPVLGAES